MPVSQELIEVEVIHCNKWAFGIGGFRTWLSLRKNITQPYKQEIASLSFIPVKGLISRYVLSEIGRKNRL